MRFAKDALIRHPKAPEAIRLEVRVANNTRYPLHGVTARLQCQLYSGEQVGLPLVNSLNATLVPGQHWLLRHKIDTASPLAEKEDLDKDADGSISLAEVRNAYNSIVWFDVLLDAQDPIYGCAVSFTKRYLILTTEGCLI